MAGPESDLDGSLLRSLLAAHPHLRGVAEQVVAPGDEPSFAKELDLLMLVLLGGRERSEDEWAALLARGGFRLASVTPAPGACLLEAEPA